MMRFRRVDINGDGPDDGEPFDLIHIDAAMFLIVREWVDYHGKLVRPLTMEDEKTVLQWQEQYFLKYYDLWGNLTMAANYLEIELLLHCCRRKLMQKVLGLYKPQNDCLNN